MADLVEHADGVYIGLAEARYQADWALGYTALKTLRHAPPKWWWKSPFNTIEPPPVDEDEAKHYRFGRASHVANLEGLDVYEATYAPVPTPAGYPGCLVTSEDLQRELRRMHLNVSGSKAELIKRLRWSGYKGLIFDEILEEHGLMGMRKITEAEDRRIRLIHRLIMRSPEDAMTGASAEVTTLKAAFEGGLSEVSVFWTDDNGIRQRCRFDKLKPRLTLDYKTFASWREDVDFGVGLLREIKQRGYLLQPAHYEVGRHMLRQFVAEGKVYGGSADELRILETIAASDVWGWLFAFAVTTGAPLVKGIRYNLGGVIAGSAARDREDALAQFLHYREFFGLDPGVMWFDPSSIMRPDDESWAIA